MRGYRKEVFSLAVWFVGFWVAWFFCPDFAILLRKIFHTQSTRFAVSFIALVSITLALGGIINWLLAGTEKKNGVTILERLGGGLVGTVHGMAIVFILVVVAGLTPLPKDRWWQASKYLPTYQSVAVSFKKVLSTRIADNIHYH